MWHVVVKMIFGSEYIPIKSSGKDLVSEKGVKSTGRKSKSTSELSSVSHSGRSRCSDDCSDLSLEGSFRAVGRTR